MVLACFCVLVIFVDCVLNREYALSQTVCNALEIPYCSSLPVLSPKNGTR